MTRVPILILCIPALAAAQSRRDMWPPPLPPAPASAASVPAALNAPVPASPPALPPITDDELRTQLRATSELLARHEAELRELRAALSAKATPLPTPPPPDAASQHWYERLAIRGYLQVRSNQIPSGVDNPNLINEQGDKSIGGVGGIFIRRARLILFGDVHPRLSIYFQPDFANSISDQLHIGMLRDFYADVFLDRKKEFRFRVGQSKVPFGFENMQSSQNRIALDRSDALNSAAPNERDLGLFFYWAPAHIRSRFKYLVDSGLKGSGDFGVIGIGAYNGQSINRPELNKYPHVVARVTWPFAIGNQILEVGGGGYYGNFTVKLENAKDGTKFTAAESDLSLRDARGHVSVVLYPQPVGVAFEYNVGVGPSLGADAESTVVDSRLLYGGYLQLMAKFDRVAHTVSMIPYLRGSMYDGGKKHFTNAPRYRTRELELGIEWQLMKAFEIVAAYMLADRTSDKYPYQQEYGHVTRLHAQVNY